MGWVYMGAFHSGWQTNSRVEIRWYYDDVLSGRSRNVLAETYIQTTNGQWIDASFSGNSRVNNDGGGSTRQFYAAPNATTKYTWYDRDVGYDANGEATVQVGGWLKANNIVTFDQSAYTNVGLPGIAPLAVSSVTVTRGSDTSHTVAWTRNATYTEVIVQRSTDGGAWAQVGRPAGNAASWVDTTTQVNRKYRYRVAGVRSGRQASWSESGDVFTSPAAPSAVSAVKDGSNISVTAAGLPPYATAYTVQESANGGAWADLASGVTSFPWVHVAPNPAVTHAYRVVASRGVLVSEPSAPSATVQLLTAPNVPSGLTPSGATLLVGGVVLSWQHNPVDTTAQSEYELRYRPAGGAWTTVSGTTVSSRTVTFTVGTFEWQVRTKGQHPDWSGWSAVASVTLVDAPGAAVVGPVSPLTLPTVQVAWTYAQAQGLPQSAWRVELLDELSTVVESREGTGAATSVVLDTRLGTGVARTVRVQVAAGAIWSGWATQPFETLFEPPAAPVASASWDEVGGAMELSVGEGRGPVVSDVTNLFTNPSFEVEELIPVGAVRSTDWSARGNYSLYVPLTSGYGHGSYGHGLYGHGPALGE